jgi:periplasmic divalent cation tolerance protein
MFRSSLEVEKMEDFVVTAVTVPNKDEGRRISRALVEERLAACVNLIAGLLSIYHWKGEICEEGEMLLWIKTRRSLIPRLQERIRDLHPYEVPEIISFTISEGNSEYLKWIWEETSNS